MTNDFRQKLLNWFCTIGIVLITSLVLPIQIWFVSIPEQQSRIVGPVDLTSWAGPIGDSATYFFVLTSIAILWHISDFAQRTKPINKFARFAVRYDFLLPSILLNSILYSLMVTEFWMYNSCAGMKDHNPFAFVHCITYPSPWISMPFVIVLVLLILLSLFKAAYSLFSQFRRNV